VICPAFFGGIEHFAKLALRSRGRFPRPIVFIVVVVVAVVEHVIRIIIAVGWEVIGDKKHGGEKYSLAVGTKPRSARKRGTTSVSGNPSSFGTVKRVPKQQLTKTSGSPALCASNASSIWKCSSREQFQNDTLRCWY
jgi:hypothetical protein